MTTRRLHLNRKALIEARVRAGLSVSDLSRAAQVHPATIYRLESGDKPSPPRVPTAKKLADALGIDVSSILGVEDAA